LESRTELLVRDDVGRVPALEHGLWHNTAEGGHPPHPV
jgi:hypothetical protein